jgi:hypothetical protein
MALIGRIRTVFSGVAGTPWYSNMYYSEAAGDFQGCADAVAAFWGAVDARIDNSVSWVIESDVTVLEWTTGVIDSVETITPGFGSGGGTSDPLPYATQGLVHWLTGDFVNGRQLRGRTFIPGLCEDDNTSAGVMVSTTATIIQNAANALITASGTNGPLMIYSPTNHVAEAVQAATVPVKWAVLRSRRD